jgi:uncharacterized membrane protein (DUF106 family)
VNPGDLGERKNNQIRSAPVKNVKKLAKITKKCTEIGENLAKMSKNSQKSLAKAMVLVVKLY